MLKRPGTPTGGSLHPAPQDITRLDHPSATPTYPRPILASPSPAYPGRALIQTYGRTMVHSIGMTAAVVPVAVRTVAPVAMAWSGRGGGACP